MTSPDLVGVHVDRHINLVSEVATALRALATRVELVGLPAANPHLVAVAYAADRLSDDAADVIAEVQGALGNLGLAQLARNAADARAAAIRVQAEWTPTRRVTTRGRPK